MRRYVFNVSINCGCRSFLEGETASESDIQDYLASLLRMRFVSEVVEAPPPPIAEAKPPELVASAPAKTPAKNVKPHPAARA